MSRHTEFDTIISTVTKRIKYIKKTSLMLDGLAGICLIIFAVIYCEIDSFYSTLILSLLQIGTGFTLAVMAYLMTKNIKAATGKKPNVCLLWWHVVNVFLNAALVIIFSSAYLEMSNARLADMDNPCQEFLFEEARGRYNMYLMFKVVLGYYLDLFLLCLILKFTRQ